MKALLVPDVGERLTLARPWVLSYADDRYYNAARQIAYADAYAAKHDFSKGAPPIPKTVEIPAGTVLTVRAYGIKGKNARPWHCFGIKFSMRYKGKSLGFYAPLEEVNQMVVK